VESNDVHARELEPLGALQRHHADRVRHRLDRLFDGRNPGLGDGDQVADEIAV